MKFLQTKPPVKKMNIKYYDVCYNVIKNRDEKEIVNIQYESNEKKFINFIDFITPNHYIGRKNDNVILT